MSELSQAFEGWGVLELLGHITVAGYIIEEQHFGRTVLRIDAVSGGETVTQYYGDHAIYCVTPCTEDVARAVAARVSRPVARFGLPRALPPAGEPEGADGQPDDDDDDDPEDDEY